MIFRSSPLKSRKSTEAGQGMAEYIIIVILVAIIVLVGVKLFGKSVINQFNNATGEISDMQND
jgi:Flp pilus assembly pilin Flp